MNLSTIDIILISVLPISFVLFSLGSIVGWLVRDYMLNYQEIPRPHPEMFDTNGNLVPDEVIALSLIHISEPTRPH